MEATSLRIFNPQPGTHSQQIDDLLRAGDLFACFGADPVSRSISWGTASLFAPRGLRLGPSHVAIACINDRGLPCGEYVWVESTTLARAPCLLHNMPVSGCQAHDPNERIRNYLLRGGRVDLYRLCVIDALSAAESALLSKILLTHFVGGKITYDMGGAIVSGARGRLLRRVLWNDLNEVFCSELVAGVLQRLGRMNRSNPGKYHPGRLLRELVRQGVYRFQQTFRLELEVN